MGFQRKIVMCIPILCTNVNMYNKGTKSNQSYCTYYFFDLVDTQAVLVITSWVLPFSVNNTKLSHDHEHPRYLKSDMKIFNFVIVLLLLTVMPLAGGQGGL